MTTKNWAQPRGKVYDLGFLTKLKWNGMMPQFLKRQFQAKWSSHRCILFFN
jgi:hypothetical protein